MNPTLSKNLKDQFASFLESHPPQQFRASLRRMLLEYIAPEIDSGIFIEFSGFLWSLCDLFDLLDEAVIEMQKQTAPPVPAKKHKSRRRKTRDKAK